MKYQEAENPAQMGDRYFVRIKKTWDKPEVRTFSAATATVFLIAFFLFVALKPTVETIFLLNKKIADARETEKLMTEKIQNLNIALSNYSQIETDIPLIENYFPSEPKTDQIVEIFIMNFKKTRLTSPEFNFPKYNLVSPEKIGQTAPRSIGITSSAKTSFNNALLFIQNLLSSNRIFSIDSLSINKREKDTNLNFNFEGKTYYEK